jgi:hypothetical protein
MESKSLCLIRLFLVWPKRNGLDPQTECFAEKLYHQISVNLERPSTLRFYRPEPAKGWANFSVWEQSNRVQGIIAFRYLTTMFIKCRTL